MSIHEKIYQIMCETEALEKNMTVGTGNSSYKAISEAEVLNMIKPLLKKYKLILIPFDARIEENVSTYETSRGLTTRCVSQLTETWKVIDVETGEAEFAVGVGNGADSQDKGPGKASTYAYKNMLSKMFMLFSGEDTDNTHSDDISKEQTIDWRSALVKMIQNETNLTFEDVAKEYHLDKNSTQDAFRKAYEGVKRELKL